MSGLSVGLQANVAFWNLDDDDRLSVDVGSLDIDIDPFPGQQRIRRT
jgi:hypothetical protein